jgi:hypothetical protein
MVRAKYSVQGSSLLQVITAAAPLQQDQIARHTHQRLLWVEDGDISRKGRQGKTLLRGCDVARVPSCDLSGYLHIAASVFNGIGIRMKTLLAKQLVRRDHHVPRTSSLSCD